MSSPKTIEPKPKQGKRGVNKGQGEVVRAKYPDTSSAATAALVDPDKPLSDQQKLFVKYWAQGESITSATARAGYADTQFGYRLARMPNVLALKEQYAKKYEATAEMDRKQVMEGLKEAIEMAKLMAEPSTMIQGWKVVAQMCGYMAPVEQKIKIDVTGNVTMKTLSALSDAELLEMIEKGSQNASPQLLTDETDGGEAPDGGGSNG